MQYSKASTGIIGQDNVVARCVLIASYHIEWKDSTP